MHSWAEAMMTLLDSLLLSSSLTECNVCYGLVGVEVDIVREMRDNLTSLLQQIKALDENEELGPFHERLAATQNSTNTLLTFVSELS